MMLSKFIFILGLVALTSFVTFGQGTAWADGIQKQPVSSCNAGANGSCKTFTITEVPYHAFGYRCFIVFGDGCYDKFDVMPPENTTAPFSISRSHNYVKSGSFNPILQIVALYDESKRPKKISFNVDQVTGDAQPVTLSPRTVDIIPSLRPRAGDNDVIYCIAFKNTCSTAISNGMIELFYDPMKVNVSFLNQLPTGVVITNDKISIPFSNLNSGEQRNEFVELDFTNKLLDPTSNFLSLSARMTGDSCLVAEQEPGVFLFPQSTYYSDAVRSHDPNLIKAASSPFCPISNWDQKVTYTIVFQNTGTGPARTVEVRTIVPEYFVLNDSTDVIMEKPYQHLKFSLKKDKREIVWVKSTVDSTLKKWRIDDWTLLGTQSKGYSVEKEALTMDSIVYTLMIDKTKRLPSCGGILNVAEIIFDGDFENSLITNTHFKGINCVDACKLCDESYKDLIKLPQQRYIRNDAPQRIVIPDSLDYLIKEGYSLNWYPPKGLDSTHVLAPLASPDRTTVYTLIASKECSRKIIEVRVLVEDQIVNENEKDDTDCSWWWWLLLVIPLSLWVLIRNKSNT